MESDESTVKKGAGKSKEYTFFQHRECKHFPCHEGIAEEDFNCLLCYCPLYTLGSHCGGAFRYNEKGNKDCSRCTVPHVRNSGVAHVINLFPQLAELARRNR